MERPIYHIRIVLENGAVVEAEVTDIHVRVNKETNTIERLEWTNLPVETGRPQLVYVDPLEISAITRQAAPASESLEDQRPLGPSLY